ncbi:hypothetical protein GM921_00430 [Pedobacter sp. LMG 31464]|uniref:O-antigen ligase-related domain-containing protein n=1 Tax=Pedobacter planticolens TaxID=2679964 RepID=A0A923DVR1_9SPHI|nr:O-antigen ligase family protein [Pedobacter planticolens]MBB2143935.1 hypothetical protein [Pedobacter planticolens]
MKRRLKHFIEQNGLDYPILYLTVLLIIATLIFQNRALFIGYIFGLFLTLYISRGSARKTRTLILIFLSLIASSVSIAFLFKTDSTEGRLLIYKLSSKILSENFPKGIGLNNFDVAYGNAQIDYFKSGHYSQKEFMLADNIIHVYNDYLELIIELGWIGLVLILTFLISIGFLVNNALKNNVKSPILLFIACVQIIAISIASLFTFMIYQVHWQCVLLISFLIVIYFNGYLRLKPVLILGVILTGSLMAYHFGRYIVFKNDYGKAAEALSLSKGGYFDDANKLYKEVYPNLKYDNAITASYIQCLMDNEEFEEAEELLANLLQRNNSSVNYDLLGNCYEKQHKIKLAETAYLNSIYKAPNRFVGRFHLFLLYQNTNQSKKAKRIGMEILKMPVKVPSNTIEYFKATVKSELRKSDMLNKKA